MKTYIPPTVEVQNVCPQNMLAVSFRIDEGETDQQLAKEDIEWDIWSEE